MLPSWQPNGSINDKSRLSLLVGYIFEEKKLKDFFKITNSYDFTTLTPIKKKFIWNYKETQRGLDDFYSSVNRRSVVLWWDSNVAVSRFAGRIQRLFVLRFYDDRRNTNFLRGLTFVGEKKRNWWNWFFWHGNTWKKTVQILEKRWSIYKKYSS